MRYPWLGINYGSGLNGYIPSADFQAQVGADLYYLKQFVTDKLRIAMPDWNFATNQIDQLKQIAQNALTHGFHVSWGVTSTNTLLTTSNWPSYQAAVIMQAQWAKSVGLNAFFIGNELDSKHDGSLTDVQQRANLRALATAVKATGYAGEVTLSVAQDKQVPWYSEGIGNLDTLGLDLYSQIDDPTFTSYLLNHVNNLGSRGYLAEWNIYNFWTTATQYQSEERLAMLIANRMQKIQESGISRAYYFTYEHTNYSNRSASDNVWSARLANGSFRPLIQPLQYYRRWLV